MTVKITKCSSDKYWYKDEISQTFEVKNKIDNCYMVWVKGLKNYPRSILIEDCEIINN